MTEDSSAINAVANNIQRVQQKFIADILTQTPQEMYRMDDYPTMRRLLFNNVKKAVQQRFPLYNQKYVLQVEDLDYADLDDFSHADQKKAVLEGASLGKKLQGCYALYDAATNKLLQKGKKRTIVTVPYMTDRGTFINNGHEYAVINIMRLQPGVYSKRMVDNTINAQFNVKKGTGAGFNMRLVPATGKFIINRGTANAPAYTVLKDIGVTDDQMKEAWGDQLYETNKIYGTGQKARIAANRIYNYK